jgi:hypothetical protein
MNGKIGHKHPYELLMKFLLGILRTADMTPARSIEIIRCYIFILIGITSMLRNFQLVRTKIHLNIFQLHFISGSVQRKSTDVFLPRTTIYVYIFFPEI